MVEKSLSKQALINNYWYVVFCLSHASKIAPSTSTQVISITDWTLAPCLTLAPPALKWFRQSETQWRTFVFTSLVGGQMADEHQFCCSVCTDLPKEPDTITADAVLRNGGTRRRRRASTADLSAGRPSARGPVLRRNWGGRNAKDSMSPSVRPTQSLMYIYKMTHSGHKFFHKCVLNVS